MFVRKKKNSNGGVSVQVIDKSTGRYKVIHTVGSSKDTNTIEKYVKTAREWIKSNSGVIELDFTNELTFVNEILNGIEHLKLKGLDLLLGRLYDQIGFSVIDDILFKYLVIYRLAFPSSKLKTSDFLRRYHQFEYDEDQIYRTLDKLYYSFKEDVQLISYRHTLKILDNQISVVFYDVTTLYFQIDKEDELRKTGFSKEGKHQNPQIVLGLLVSKNGYPLAYDIFEGNKFEGHTMLPIIDSFKEKYDLTQLIIVADSGLLSSSNILELKRKGYEFILGARIKNETKKIQDEILNFEYKNGSSRIIYKGDLKLIVTYSEKRAIKDSRNRKKGLERLEKQIKSGKLTKANINKRGYNKYLKLNGDIEVELDYQKFKEDDKWDGLKGYITNAKLSKEDIIENYKQLWEIEKAFRIAKTDLKIRPIYHRKQRRIEAHICISFTAYKIYKELERLLANKKTELSPEKAIEIAKSIYEIKLVTPESKKVVKRLLILTDEQRELAKLFDF